MSLEIMTSVDLNENSVTGIPDNIQTVGGKKMHALDDALSDVSENPIQNKAIKAALDALDTKIDGKNVEVDGYTIKKGYQDKLYGVGYTQIVNGSTKGEIFNVNATGRPLPAGLGSAAGNQSHAEGNHPTADGDYSHAEGYYGTATGTASHAEGNTTVARGDCSHAEGSQSIASGNSAHAEGTGCTASGGYSHAEGEECTAAGVNSHAEGRHTEATYLSDHAEGYYTVASGMYCHVEGSYSKIKNNNCVAGHAEGSYTESYGSYSHAEGGQTLAFGTGSHTEGYGSGTIPGSAVDSMNRNDVVNAWSSGHFNIAYGSNTHTEGYCTLALDSYAHAEGSNTLGYGTTSHAEGYGSTAFGTYSHAEGYSTNLYIPGRYQGNLDNIIQSGGLNLAFGSASHVEGRDNIAGGDRSHVEGGYNKTKGISSHVEGEYNVIGDSGYCTHIEGYLNTSEAYYSHAEGSENTIAYNASYCHAEGRHNTIAAAGTYSHAEGYDNTVSNSGAHAEGYKNTVSGLRAHVEGSNNLASGNSAHAEGFDTEATGDCAHAEGTTNKVFGPYSHVEGGYNISRGGYTHVEGYHNEIKGINNDGNLAGFHISGAFNEFSGEYQKGGTLVAGSLNRNLYLGSYAGFVAGCNNYIGNSSFAMGRKLAAGHGCVAIGNWNRQGDISAPNIKMKYSTDTNDGRHRCYMITDSQNNVESLVIRLDGLNYDNLINKTFIAHLKVNGVDVSSTDYTVTMTPPSSDFDNYEMIQVYYLIIDASNITPAQEYTVYIDISGYDMTSYPYIFMIGNGVYASDEDCNDQHDANALAVTYNGNLKVQNNITFKYVDSNDVKHRISIQKIVDVLLDMGVSITDLEVSENDM